jgi:hypothetical protein
MSDIEQAVSINGEQHTIQRFRGLKAVLVLASVSRIMQDVPDLIAEASKEYSAKHTISITEDMAKLPRWEGFTSADFDIAEQKTGKRVIELPAQANGTEALLAALPKLIGSTARREVVRLFALLLIPNAKLKIADKEDRVNDALDEYEDLILFDAEIDELAELAAAAQETIKQLDTKRNGQLGELLRRGLEMLGLTLPQMPSASGPETPSTEETTSIPQTLPLDAPTLFTPSESPTDGIETQRSTVSLGAS